MSRLMTNENDFESLLAEMDSARAAIEQFNSENDDQPLKIMVEQYCDSLKNFISMHNAIIKELHDQDVANGRA